MYLAEAVRAVTKLPAAVPSTTSGTEYLLGLRVADIDGSRLIMATPFIFVWTGTTLESPRVAGLNTKDGEGGESEALREVHSG